jgi:hypothetical protein
MDEKEINENTNKLKEEFDRKEAFLKEYRELVEKHGYDFMQQPPTIVKVSLIKK